MSLSQSGPLLPLHSVNDFQPFGGDLCTPPLLFRRRPPQSNCPPDTVHSPVSRRHVRIPATEEWYPNGGSTKTGVLASKPPTYPVHPLPKSNIRLQSSSTGSFRPVAGNGHLHPYFNFTGLPVETALKSLHHSCGSELTRQGISLP